MKITQSLAVLAVLGTSWGSAQSATIANSPEKDRFIYGRPGDDDYGKPRSSEQVIELEKMWHMDLDMQKFRGFLQGFHRGLYKDYDWEIQEKCLSRNTLRQLFYIQELIANFNPIEILRIFALLYNVYYNVDFECTIENTLFDFACFCFDHDCSWQKLLQNEMSKVF